MCKKKLLRCTTSDQLSKEVVPSLNRLTENDSRSDVHVSETSSEVVIENIENDSDFHSEDEILPVHVMLLTPNLESAKHRHYYMNSEIRILRDDFAEFNSAVYYQSLASFWCLYCEF